MSYQLVRNIKINKKKEKIFIYSSDNNVTPKRFYKRDFDYKNTDFESKKYNLFVSLIDGDLQFCNCKDNYIKKAFDNFLEYLGNNGLYQQDLWEYSKYSDEMKKYYGVFNNLLSIFERKGLVLEEDLKNDKDMEL